MCTLRWSISQQTLQALRPGRTQAEHLYSLRQDPVLTGLSACADTEMEDAAADGGAAGPSHPSGQASGQAAAQAGPLSGGQREAVLMQMNQILTRQVSLTVDELMAALAAKGLRYGRQAVKQVGLYERMVGTVGLALLHVLSMPGSSGAALQQPGCQPGGLVCMHGRQS